MTAVGDGRVAELFVTNVLNGTVAANGKVVHGGTVVRLVLTTPSRGSQADRGATIGSGFAERTDPAALVIGPTGVGLGRNGTLYVADTQNNRIAAIPDAPFRLSSSGTARRCSGRRLMVRSGWSPRRTATSSPPTPSRQPGGDHAGGSPGPLRGSTPPAPRPVQGSSSVWLAPDGHGVYFVDDATNTLNLLH